MNKHISNGNNNNNNNSNIDSERYNPNPNPVCFHTITLTPNFFYIFVQQNVNIYF